ncbi:hypothetical protein PYV61_10050, partial [Roseisolibacter sp. H3M3-2]
PKTAWPPTCRWGVVLGAEAGGGSAASTSRATPDGGAPVAQRTALDLTGVQWAGVEWTALRWRPAAGERLRVTLGAGAGAAAYRLRQWGAFVDAERRVAYEDDFRSRGRGAVAYAQAAVAVPVRRWLAVQGDVRRQAGSAPMTDDFAGFDRLDLGGTRLGVGVTVRPGR